MSNSTEQFNDIALSEMLDALRLELEVAAKAGESEDIRFGLAKVELEVEVALKRNMSAGGGLSFWVVTAKGQHAAEHLTKHKFKLTLDAKHQGGDIIMNSAGLDTEDHADETDDTDNTVGMSSEGLQ